MNNINYNLDAGELAVGRIAQSSLALALQAIAGSNEWYSLPSRRKRALQTKYLNAKMAKLRQVLEWLEAGNWPMLINNVNELNPGWKAIFEAVTGLNVPGKPEKATAFLVNELWNNYKPVFDLRKVK